MNDDIAIKVENVSKKFCKSLKRSMLYGIKDIAKNSLGMSSNSHILRKDEFWAVDDVSFEVKRGETLGIIGPNGAGKTTILKLLNGIFWPDKGKITIKGKTGALISVGAGFHPMLTGRENIYLNAAILGMSRHEVNRKFDDIVEFADIGDFLDTPVKFYSSGMFVRLGFSVALHCNPDILLVDEVLAVGDIDFQAKCFNRIGNLKKGNNIAGVLVSHNMHKVSGFCDKVLYLFNARTAYIGDTATAIETYKKDVHEKKLQGNDELEVKKARGTGVVRIKAIKFLNENGEEIIEIKSGDVLLIKIQYEAINKVGEVELDVSFRCDGYRIFQATNTTYNKKLNIPKGHGTIELRFDNFCLNCNKLLFFFALWRKDRTELFDWKREIPLKSIGNSLSDGKILLDLDWKLKEKT